MKKVNLNDIRIDGGTQNRKVIDQSRVYNMVEMMKEGDEFTPIDTNFDGVTYWLVDGFHRYHAYKLLGIKEVTIRYVPGTQAEAVIRSYGVNANHGLPRSFEEKQEIVQKALANPDLAGASVYEIAKICRMSQPFVAGVKDPSKKQKQKQDKEKSIIKKAEELKSEIENQKITNQISSENTTGRESPNLDSGATPDEDELKANELAMQADQEAMYKLLESDDALATAHEEIKRLNLRVAQLETRLSSLMTEKNEAIKDAKRAQAQLDKIRKAKK